MLIRRNSKEFKNLAQKFEDLAHDPARAKLVRMYIVKVGEGLDKRIATSDVDTGSEVYFNMAFETALNSFRSKNFQLHQSDNDPSIYFFRTSAQDDWDQTPFEFISANKVSDDRPVQTKKKESDRQRKAVKPKAKRTVKEPLPTKTSLSATKKATAKPEEKSDQKEYKLKHPVIFHYKEKLLIGEQNVTKKDVLDYYDQIAPLILPYLKNRPMFFRWHRGSIKSSQYNKSLESLKRDWKGEIPSWLEKVELTAVSYNEKRNYMLCPDRDHLLFMVELGCIELSPWHSSIQSIENPDYMVIDLDPVDVEFKYVVEAAMVCKHILDGLKLPSKIKTSGSKGLHIYIPLDATSDFETSRNLCELICKLIHLKSPHLTSLERLPGQRRGKVYLDYLQNSFAKSIVAPYSLRPNTFAGVATPMAWDELNSQTDLKDFNIHNTLKRIGEYGDPFRDWLKTNINAGQKLKEIKELYEFLI